MNNQHFEIVDDKLFDATLIGDEPSGSEAWHALRAQGIGGSDVGAIMGLNQWESAFSLWATRTGQIPAKDISANWGVRFGNAFEEPILRMWSEDNPQWEIFKAGTFAHPTHTHILANPDALARHRETGEWMVVEIKTARAGWPSLPASYRAQVMQYMFVFGIKRAVVVAVAGWNWTEIHVPYDLFEAEAQLAACNRFWEHLTQVVRPEWDGSKATYEAQRQLNQSVVDDDVDLGDLGEVLLDAQEVFDDAESDLLKAKSAVLDRLGKAKYGKMDRDGTTVRVVQRQNRGGGTPWLVVKKGK